MEEKILGKYKKLKDIIKSLGKVAIAFSGGVDSTLLLYAASEALGDDVIAVTAVSEIRHKEEKERAQKTAIKIGIKHIIVESAELELPEVISNGKNRCYHCKKNIFSKVKEIAEYNGMHAVIEASTCDDMNIFRPGRKAVEELGVRSPLVDAGFSKKDVVTVLKELDPEVFEVPGESCLLTRFPYGEEIDKVKLSRVRGAEENLKRLGFLKVRVRTYSDLARIEVPEGDIARLLREDTKTVIVDKMKALGYKYITIDIEGFRSGSMDL